MLAQVLAHTTAHIPAPGSGYPGAHRSWLRAVAAGLTLAAAATCAQDPPDKLDADLTDPDRRYPVFVRMVDQVFRRGGDYAAFCEQHETAPRSRVRDRVLRQLREYGDKSWQSLRDAVDALTERGQLRDVERFWIVNGFACDATGSACAALAERDEVAFVYRQRQPGGWTQQGTASRSRPRSWIEARRRDTERALAAWRDDADDPFALTDPDDPDADVLSIPWNLERIGAPRAWSDGALGQGVVIALCDSGVLITPPLLRALWRNPREDLDGEDDDGNGFVDDVFGWDFETDTPWCVGDGPRSHGTMCGGILAARAHGEPRTVTGVAPRARLMVLRGMGRLAAYQYAAAQGADVVSMSYMWIGVELGHYRGLYRTAHEHLAACGVVAVGGAGNFRRNAPAGRQIALPKDVPCVIAAAGILEDGEQAPFSSEGPCSWQGVRFYDDFPPDAPLFKPDVTGCAGGYPVWHWTNLRGRRLAVVWQGDDDIGLVKGPRGNSFSGPHAGGVAALMFSVNPELTAWRVKRLMEQTCRDLGQKGPDTAFGHGLLQAHDAVRAARAAEIDD